MKLTELLHFMKEEDKKGLVPIDDWRWPDVDHLVTMGFEFNDDYHMSTTKPPHLTVFQKKEVNENDNKKTSYFYVEEPERGTKRFKSFSDVIDYFDTYVQPDLDKNM